MTTPVSLCASRPRRCFSESESCALPLPGFTSASHSSAWPGSGALVSRAAVADDAIAKSRRGAKKKQFEDLFAFQCRAHRLPDSHEQFHFARELGRKFCADRAWPQFKLLVEIQGGIWQRGGGGHSHPMHIEKDITKAQYAVLAGYALLPVTTDEVKSGHAIEVTRRALIARGWVPGIETCRAEAP